jgi:hypothetical protein
MDRKTRNENGFSTPCRPMRFVRRIFAFSNLRRPIDKIYTDFGCPTGQDAEIHNLRTTALDTSQFRFQIYIVYFQIVF